MEEAGYRHPDGRSSWVAAGGGGVLVHRDGHRVAFLEEGRDGRGEYLVIEHLWTHPGMMAGPHWHPVLEETFRVREGRMRFRVDGEEFVLGAGGEVTVSPGQVHRFWKEGGGLLRVVHEVRPPGHHREMFELWRTPLAAKATYGLTVVGTEFAWFVLVAIFVSSATVRRRFDAVSLWVERTTGAFLIALGVRLAFSRASA